MAAATLTTNVTVSPGANVLVVEISSKGGGDSVTFRVRRRPPSSWNGIALTQAVFTGYFQTTDRSTSIWYLANPTPAATKSLVITGGTNSGGGWSNAWATAFTLSGVDTTKLPTSSTLDRLLQ